MAITVMRHLINFIKKEDGLGTVEIVLIIAVLVGLALIFRGHIMAFLEGLMETILGDDIAPVFDPVSTP